MIDPERIVCICNNMSVREVAALIRERRIETLETLVEEAKVGNKCESCVEEGYENDGFSLAMVLALVREGRL